MIFDIDIFFDFAECLTITMDSRSIYQEVVRMSFLIINFNGEKSVFFLEILKFIILH